MVKTIKIAGMDSYIAKFTPENSRAAAEYETPAASESDSKSVKTTKKSTAKK